MKDEFGLPLDMPPFKGKIHPDYRNGVFIEQIFDCRELLSDVSCSILLDSRNRVGRIELPISEARSRTVVIKEFRTQGIDRLKTAFLPSKAEKAWRGSSALYIRGINTPAPVAFLEEKAGRYVNQNYFIAEMVEGVEEIRFVFRRLKGEDLKELLSALAGFLSPMRAEGLVHRDLSDGNILVKHGGENYVFYLIDTNRVRERKHVGLLAETKSLIRLGIPKEDQKYFLRIFYKKEKLPLYIWIWYSLNKNRFTWIIALKKALRLKKITQKLKIQ